MTTQTPNIEVTEQWTLVPTTKTRFNVEVCGKDAYVRIATAPPTDDKGHRLSESSRANNNKDIFLSAGEMLYARAVDDKQPTTTTLIITGE